MNIGFKKDLLYMQLKEAILSGKYPPGTKLPRELEFAAQLGVAFVTLRSALKRLEEEGFITRLRSRGTFVNELSAQKSPANGEKIRILLPFRGQYDQENIISNVFNRNFALGVFSQAAFYNMTADVQIVPPETTWTEQLASARKNGYSAMILDRYNQDLLNGANLKETGMPLVLANREMEGVPSVSCNYVSAIRMAVQRLREFGHREILLLDHDSPRVPNFQERHRAFEEELARGGIRDPHSHFISMRDVEWEDYLPWITSQMRKHPEATAVIVQSFYLNHFAQYLANSGTSVPGDLSVIQWGERTGCERSSPLPYSLLTDPRTECGQTAVDLIHRMIGGEDCSAYHFKLNAELIMRNGCALPRTLRSRLAESCNL